MSCPSLEDLLRGAGADHAAGCPACRAILELAATRAEGELTCGLAEGLIAAQVAGALAPGNKQALARHLAACPVCRQLARDLESPAIDQALDIDSARGDIADLTAVPD